MLLHSEGNYQPNEKGFYWMGEVIRKQYIWQGINTQNIQRAHTIQHLKKTRLKNGQKIWTDFFPMKTGTWKDVQHHRSSGKKQMKTTWYIASHLSEWLLSKKKQQITSIGEDVEKREPSCSANGNVNWCSYYRKQYGDSSKNKKQNYHYHPAVSFLGTYLKKMKTLEKMYVSNTPWNSSYANIKLRRTIKNKSDKSSQSTLLSFKSLYKMIKKWLCMKWL